MSARICRCQDGSASRCLDAGVTASIAEPVRGRAKFAVRSLAVATVALLSSGCVEQLESGLIIVNESGQPLTVSGQVVPENGRQVVLTSGGKCGGPGLSAHDERGNVYATLDSDWCPDDVWTIALRGQSSLDRVGS
ncbi:hypothetical protein [Nocardioides okcheonensis]|uniref:hypothetical protein n=1 Tax=Nocardioides okcheonensis TaxID=2894081 RepID=UPI001E489C04|nr:hypothetical protein [Nocardioides okcheonensis]UFN45691.1 hypothetical protein LN652_05630 [Nocardioides okcheonensis]